MKLLNWRNAGTLLFLMLPVTGLWLLLEGIYQGPNYFSHRVVVVEHLESPTSTSRSGRFGMTEVNTVWKLDYHYTDAQGKVRHSQKVLRRDDPPPSTLQSGGQLFTRIAVNQDEGGFGLNPQAEQGLSLILVFGWLSLVPIAELRWRHNPDVKREWYRIGIAVLGVFTVIALTF